MSWMKVDDTLAFNAKVLMAGNEAMGLWIRAGSWCAAQMTDGVVPHHIVAVLAGGEANAEALASQLLEAGLWERFDGPLRAYVFHDWSEYQPSAEQTRDRRRKRAEAGRLGGLKSGAARRNGGEANASQLLEANTKQKRTPSRPVPSQVTDSLRESVASPDADPPAPKKRASRLPEKFIPQEATRKTILGEYPQLDIAHEHAKFVDYWTAQPGQRGVKLDWDAVWRNWMRREGDSTTHRGNTRQQQTDAQFARAMERARAADAAAAAGQPTTDAFGLPVQPALEGKVL